MKKIFFAIVSTLLVAGCAKENLVEQMGPQDGVTVLTAGTPSTKTVLQNDQMVLWTNGDKINVNGVESNALAIEEDAVETATFTIPGDLSNPYKALFPASIYKDAQTVTLPAVQAYAENSFGATAAPMAAYQASGNNLNFQHLCAVLKLTIEKAADAHEIMYVEFSGKNDEQVCGDFSIDYQKAELTGVSTSTSAKKVRCNVYNALSEEGLVVYLVVPAMEYASGYTIKVVDTEGHYMEKSKASSQTLEKGKIYDMPAFAFDPTGTEFDVGITTAQDLIDFAKKYNEGTKQGVAAILNDIEFTAQDCADFESIKDFDGTIDGKWHKIAGFNVNKPFVLNTVEGALIKDLTISGTMTFPSEYEIEGACAPKTTTSSINAYGFGVFAGENIGELNNCHNYVNLAFEGKSESVAVALGGLVGVNCGKIEDCSNFGHMDFTLTFTTNQYLYIGGIAGANGGSSIVNNADMKGHIQVLGESTGSTFWLGGIIGKSFAGTSVTDCDTYLISDESEKAADAGYKATILLSGNYKKPMVGGLFGAIQQTPTSYCTNNADVSIIYADPSQPSYLGGICGLNQTNDNKSEIQNCTNTGTISHYSLDASVDFFVGGLVGQNRYKFISCTNLGAVVVAGTDTGKGRVCVGGLAGNFDVSAALLDGCTAQSTLTYGEGVGTDAIGVLLGLASSHRGKIANCKYRVLINDQLQEWRLVGAGNPTLESNTLLSE